MTTKGETPNSLLERNDERQSVAEVWRRTWRASVIVEIQDSHAKLVRIDAGILARMEARLAKQGEPLTAEDAVLFQCGERVNKMLSAVRGDMMQLGLHPTRPKATQPSRGNRPRCSDPVFEAHIVAPPDPDGVPSEGPVGTG